MSTKKDGRHEVQDFSADAYVYRIMLEYLQPFELASVTGEHTNKTYLNAAAFGSIEYLKTHKVSKVYLNGALHIALIKQNIEVVQLLISLGTNEHNLILYGAASTGQTDIVHMLLNAGADDINNSLRAAAVNGHLETIKLFALLNVGDLNFALQGAAYGGQIDAIYLLVTLGATDFDQAYNAALDHNQYLAAAVLIKIERQN